MKEKLSDQLKELETLCSRIGSVIRIYDSKLGNREGQVVALSAKVEKLNEEAATIIDGAQKKAAKVMEEAAMTKKEAEALLSMAKVTVAEAKDMHEKSIRGMEEVKSRMSALTIKEEKVAEIKTELIEKKKKIEDVLK